VAAFDRIVHPTPAEYERAAQVCYARFPYQRVLDSPERFHAFGDFGVELAVMRHQDGSFQCVAFLLPSELRLGAETLRWHYMFQVASLPGAPGAGALLIRQVMQWYPAIFGMGITADAERLYKAFRWQHYDGFWRGVHPIDLSRMIADYGSRVASPAARSLLRAVSGIYSRASIPMEWLLAFGRSATPISAQPGASPAAGKVALLASYLRLFKSGPVRVADVGGMARLLSAPEAGSLTDHAALWRTLRKIDAKACEMLLLSRASCRRAMRLGYLPLALQVYCWDTSGVLARAIPILKQRGLTFLDTDKTV
jgi:hypothetical protein